MDAIKFASDSATRGLRQLASEVGAWHAGPTAGGEEAVEVQASAVRRDIIKIRHLRDSVPQSNPAVRKIAQAQLDRVSRQYFDLLASLSADIERATNSMDRRGVEYSGDQQQIISDGGARNFEICQIEKGVTSIHAMMQELQGLVLEQGEALDAVDKNVDAAHEETARAYKKLGRAQRLKAHIHRRKALVGGLLGAILLGVVVGLILLLAVVIV